MEEDDMVMRVGNSLVLRERETNRRGGKGCKPEGSIRRCQGLAKGWPWQPAKRSLIGILIKLRILIKILKGPSLYYSLRKRSLSYLVEISKGIGS